MSINKDMNDALYLAKSADASKSLNINYDILLAFIYLLFYILSNFRTKIPSLYFSTPGARFVYIRLIQTYIYKPKWSCGLARRLQCRRFVVTISQ